MYRINEGASRCWPVLTRRTRLRRRLWPFSWFLSRRNAVTVPSRTKVGGPPPLISFFRLRRAVVAIVDKRRRKKGKMKTTETTMIRRISGGGEGENDFE